MKIFLLAFTLISHAAFAYDALIWGGPGACPEGCVESVVHVTRLAGFNPMIVTPENFDAAIFETARLWIQPGGVAATASEAMGASKRKVIKTFIANGGGYVGFCAGSYLTTPRVGKTRVPGLGLVQGKTRIFREEKITASVEELITPSGISYQYWEGGPFYQFTKSQLKKVNVRSRYRTNNGINAIETTYGKGRVTATGTHPEAPQWWYDDSHLADADGLDNDEAVRMIKWAAKP